MSKYLERFYKECCNEDGRLKGRAGQIEYLTTMKYINEYVKSGRVLVLGAGTGRYSLALARTLYSVSAVELSRDNVEVFKSKLKKDDDIKIHEGNAMDLSMFSDSSFDAVLILGPMYHLYRLEDKLRVLSEAKRVCKNNGFLFIAYCMNEAIVVQKLFNAQGDDLEKCRKYGIIDSSFKFKLTDKEIFELVRLEDIDKLNELMGFDREKLVGTDMFTGYIKDQIEGFSEELFDDYIKYHFSICERMDLIGLSNHTLDIIKNLK